MYNLLMSDKKVKITVYLTDPLVDQIKEQAREQKRSLSSQIEYNLTRHNAILFDLPHTTLSLDDCIKEALKHVER